MKYDVEYHTAIYITARGIEAGSREEAIELADAQWRSQYPVDAAPSGSAPWLRPDDIHVSKEWDINYVTGDNPEADAARDAADPAALDRHRQLTNLAGLPSSHQET